MASLECREGMALLVSKINRQFQGLRLILMPFTLREDSDYLHMIAVSGNHTHAASLLRQQVILCAEQIHIFCQ